MDMGKCMAGVRVVAGRDVFILLMYTGAGGEGALTSVGPPVHRCRGGGIEVCGSSCTQVQGGGIEVCGSSCTQVQGGGALRSVAPPELVYLGGPKACIVCIYSQSLSFQQL